MYSFCRRLAGVTLGLVVLCGALPLQAHRLDELLQATYVAIEADHARVVLRLAPGVEVVPPLLALIDTNGDGEVASGEQQRFAAAHLAQVDVAFDGRPSVLALSGVVFPTPRELADGTGVIELTGVTTAPGSGTHAITIANQAQPVASVYQANALQPAREAVRILGQTRDPQQRTLRVDYSVSGGGAARGAVVWIPLLTGIALIVFRAAERRRPEQGK